MKLSVVAPEKAEELIPRISQFANSQNAVRASDFFANHPFHRRVGEMSRGILAPVTDGSQVQTHWFYERARGQGLNEQAGLTATRRARFARMNPKRQVITKTDLAKVETCFALEPDTACRGAEEAFVAYAGKITELWKDERKPAEITDDWFRAVVARTIIFRTAEKVVSEAGWCEGGYRAQVVAYICARLAKLAAGLSRGGRLDYRRMWGMQACDAVLCRQLDAIGEVMMRVLRTPPREGQNISEWAKQQACREAALRSEVPIIPGFEAWVADMDTARAESQEARAAGEVDQDLQIMQEVLSRIPLVVTRIVGSAWERVAMGCDLMAGRSRLTATPAQVVALRELARSDIRGGEADRARAILLTLDGWTSVELAQALGVTAASVRHWRARFAAGGVAALRATPAPGPSPERGERALAVARELPSGPVEDRTNRTPPRLRAEIGRRAGPTISRSRLSLLLRGKGGSAGGGPGIR